MIRDGEHSVFFGNGLPIDNYDQKSPGDLITSLDWNKMGDSLYRIESEILALKSKVKQFNLVPEVKIWFGNFNPVWDLAAANQLSATGTIIIPTSACVLLGTTTPLYHTNMVKVTVTQNLPQNLRVGIGTNITSAIYCPESNNPGISTYNAQLLSSLNSANKTTTYSESPSTTPVNRRTLIVGLYCDGYPVPQDLNNFRLTCSVLLITKG